MRCLAAGCLLALGVVTTPLAAETKFPYEATVVSREAYVRSGPSRSFYPTGKLKQADKVQVHRHDPGGWYMIAPPPNSFSWIRADYVRKQGKTQGILTETNVVVRVGSNFDDVRDVEQRRLSTGDEVTILGEKTFETERGTIRMYRILPPKGEYRWLRGQDVLPVGAKAKQTRDNNPFEVPSDVMVPTEEHVEFGSPQGDSDVADGPLSTDVKPTTSSPRNNLQQPIQREPAAPAINQNVTRTRITEEKNAWQALKQQVEILDEQFSALKQSDISEWDFNPIAEGYVHLMDKHPEYASQLEARLNVLEVYQQRKDAYDDVMKLIEETNRKDAELAAKQQQPVPRNENTTTPKTPDTQAISGAGIVHRSATNIPNAPAYILIAPDGRLLAYLQAEEGVNLEPYVGQQMGIVGERTREPSLNSDIIRVQSVTPVRFK